MTGTQPMTLAGALKPQDIFGLVIGMFPRAVLAACGKMARKIGNAPTSSRLQRGANLFQLLAENIESLLVLEDSFGRRLISFSDCP